MARVLRPMRVAERRSQRVNAPAVFKGAPKRAPGSRAYHSGESTSNPRSKIYSHERALQELLQRYERARGGSNQAELLTEALGHVREINEIRARMTDEKMPTAARLRDYWVGVELPRNFNLRDDGPSSGKLMRAARVRVQRENERAQAEAAAEAAARRGSIDFHVGGKKEKRWEIYSEEARAKQTENRLGAAENYLKMHRHWMKHNDVSRAADFLVQIQSIALKLPPAKQKEWFGKLAEESYASGREFEAKNDAENWALFTLFAEQNRAAQAGNEEALLLIKKERGLSTIHANLQRRTIDVVVGTLQLGEKEESTAVVQQLLRTVPSQLVRVLAARVKALQKSAGRKPQIIGTKRSPVEKQPGSLPVDKPSAERAPTERIREKKQVKMRRAARVLTWEENLLTRLNALHPADQQACRQYVAVAGEATRQYFNSARKNRKKDANRFMEIQDAAMNLFWRTMGLKPPSFR